MRTIVLPDMGALVSCSGRAPHTIHNLYVSGTKWLSACHAAVMDVGGWLTRVW